MAQRPSQGSHLLTAPGNIGCKVWITALDPRYVRCAFLLGAEAEPWNHGLRWRLGVVRQRRTDRQEDGPCMACGRFIVAVEMAVCLWRGIGTASVGSTIKERRVREVVCVVWMMGMPGVCASHDGLPHVVDVSVTGTPGLGMFY